MKSFLYIRQPSGLQPHKHVVISAQTAIEAVTYIAARNKFEDGHEYLLLLIQKYYDNILEYVPDNILTILEEQGGLNPWTAAWWEQAGEAKISLQELLKLGIVYKVITYDILYRHITKKETGYTYKFVLCDTVISL